MFCTNCGNQFQDGTAFCPNCGTPVNAAPQQPAQPVYQQPVQPQQPVYQQPVYQQPAPQQAAPAGDFAGMMKKNMALILAIIGVFAALMFILNTFQILDISATVSANGESETASGPVSDVEDFALGVIGNVVMGLCSLAAGAIGILYFLKEKNNMPYYDQFIAKNLKGMSPAFIMGVIGAIGVVLQVILFLMEGESTSFMGVEVSVTYWPNWLSWVALVIYGGLAAVDKFVVNKKAA